MPPVRHLFTFASVVSLLVCLATLLLCKASYSEGSYNFESGLFGGDSMWYLNYYGGYRGNLVVGRSSPYRPIATVDISVRLWVVAGIALLLPMSRLALWLVRRGRTHLRKEAGRCISCNYDLTGNVSGICPECGTKISN